MHVYCTRARGLVGLTPHEDFTMYVCGITPYDSMHVGHVALLLTYDVLARRMASLGARVRMVRNITDVDDPLLPRAQSLGVPYWELVEKEITQLAADVRRLDLPADSEPRASSYVAEMAEAVVTLLGSGRAYRLDDRVYFAVDTDPGFGSLSKYPRNQMLLLAAERGGDPERPGKKNPLDFVLWQPARPGEPEYQTRLGVGRPGWHIGCSVMAKAHLGSHITVHGGGDDLIFPHHEAELSQNRGLPGYPDADVWLHGAPVAYRGEKMSKSKGNIVLARDLLRSWDPRVLRLACLAHYHHQHGFEWRDELLEPAAGLLAALTSAAAAPTGPDLSGFAAELAGRLDDDLDFPGAVAVLARAAARAGEGGNQRGTSDLLRQMAALLGVQLGQ
jgi:L-cysteine:1D-myo-inositol 2-amino-2-deoxy-alpha-D-glucopyranoside ligase